ncbi:MAG: DUF3604 domain-containing protein [Acidimicrobiales bacterium]
MIHECDGHDHRLETYAGSDRRLLDLVQSFNHRLVRAVESGADLSKVFSALDPDPARYTWVDEGAGMVEAVLAEAEAALASAPVLPGFANLSSTAVPTSLPAARPAVAVAPDGRCLVAWIEWHEQLGEQVLAALLDREGGVSMEPLPVSGALGDYLRPSVAFDGDGHGWVFFGHRRGGAVGVFAARLGGDGWAEPVLVSTTSHPSFNQELVCHPDGAIECCWQGYKQGRFHIFSRRQVGREDFGETHLVSDEAERNVWDPTVAVDGAGRTCYAWTTYGASGYRTAMLLHQDGASPVRQVLGEPGAYSLHPSIAFDGEGSLWCAYDSVALGGHAGSGPTRLRTRSEMDAPRRTGTKHDGRAVPGDLAPDVTAEVTVVRLGEVGGVPEPTGDVGTGALVSPAGLPRLVCTSGGAVAVAYRCLRRLPLMLYFWDTVLEWHGSDGWGHLTTFDEPDGPLEEPAFASSGEGAVVCWQQDGRKERGLAWTEGFGGEECAFRRRHYGEVVWHSLHTGGQLRIAAAVAPAGLAGQRPAAAVARHGSIGEAAPDARRWARARAGTRSERYRASVGEHTYGLYWGDLHRHSLISRCTAGDEPELDDFYRYSFDVCEYDFWAVTDHAENTSQYQWWAIQKLADVLNVDGRFVPFYGFEWTSATGHQNVIYESRERGAPIYSSTAAGTSTPPLLWDQLRSAGQKSITIPHHPGSAMVRFDWSYHDEEMMRLVEVFQACRGNYEAEGCFRQYSDGTLSGTFVSDGLRQGHRFGLISSSDHGNGASYVGAFAEELTRQSVFAALYDRRTIAATTRDIVVDFRLNDCFMGGVAAPASTASVAVTARGYREIARVDIIRNGVVSRSFQTQPEVAAGEVVLPLRVEWSTGSTPVTDWGGCLEIDAGRILDTSFWSPEIVEVGTRKLTWAATTRNFYSQYGAQRGGVELTVVAPPETTLRVSTKALAGTTTLAALSSAGRLELGRSLDGTLCLQQGTGGLLSLGTSTIEASHDEPVVEPSWYYARVMLEDGEMAWSSPVWICPPS